jgi:hypothetical protein
MSDREKEHLRGSVRVVHSETNATANESEAEGQESFRPLRTVIYNEAGDKIKECFYALDGQPSEIALTRYDSEKKIEEAFYKPSGGLLRYTTFSYDEAGRETGRKYVSLMGRPIRQKSVPTYDAGGRKIEEAWFYEDDTRSHKYVYVYGPTGLLAEQTLHKYSDEESPEETHHTIYDTRENIKEYVALDAETKVIVYRYVYSYDDEGNTVEAVAYNPDNSIYGRAFYSYEFDSAGNWIKQAKRFQASQTPSRDVEIIRRTITYYGSSPGE